MEPCVERKQKFRSTFAPFEKGEIHPCGNSFLEDEGVIVITLPIKILVYLHKQKARIWEEVNQTLCSCVAMAA